MENEWGNLAGDWDSNEDVMAYSELAFKHLSKLNKFNDANVIDFGCGTGLLTEKMSPLVKSITSIDPSKKMIDVLAGKTLPNVTVINDVLTSETINKYNLKSASFDLVVASSVFGFISEFGKVITCLKSLLTSGGFLVQWDWLSPKNNPDFGLTLESVEKTLVDIGFSNTSLAVPFSLSNPEGDMPVLMAVAQNP